MMGRRWTLVAQSAWKNDGRGPKPERLWRLERVIDRGGGLKGRLRHSIILYRLCKVVKVYNVTILSLLDQLPTMCPHGTINLGC
jgi:hypothetical protein